MASTASVSADWTYERYLELEDDQRYEILDGELLLTPAPGTRHQRIALELTLRITSFVRERGLGEILFAPTDVVFSQKQVVQPDILFIRADRVTEIVHEQAVRGAPDLVVEILSPTSLHRDRHRKRALYERVGIPEYWIVDPANRAIEVFSLAKGGYELTSFAAEKGQVTSRVLEGFTLEVGAVIK